MKKIVILIFLFFSLTLTAQDYYYDITRTFQGGDYSYQCDVLEGAKFVTLYNKNSKFVNTEQINENTGKQMSINYRKQLLEEDSWTRLKCFSIINNAFSDAEKLLIKEKNRSLSILLCIDSKTGKIADVVYNFISNTPFGTIPVSVYRKIEQELKENVWFVPTGEGRKWNYIALGWVHTVK